MTIEQQLQAIKEYVLQDKVEGQILFDTSVIVKKSPHSEICRVHGVAAHLVHGVYLLDGNGEWHEITVNDNNASYVISSVHQRIKLISTQTNQNITA